MITKKLLAKICAQVFVVIASIFPLFVEVFVSYDLRGAGEHPQKHLELTQIGPLHPLEDLGNLVPDGRVTLHIGERSLKNLFIIHANIHNVGKSPILPSDFHENLAVEVGEPWEIVAIENDQPRNAQLKWVRSSKNKFDSAPTLLNPGDIASFVIYLTNDSTGPQTTLDKKSEPKLKWQARIINLKGIDYSDVVGKMEKSFESKIPFVHLSGWKLVFFTVAGMTNFMGLLFSLKAAGFLRQKGWRPLLWIMGAATLSIIAAECASTYIFGNSVIPVGGLFLSESVANSEMLISLFHVDHWFNAPWLILNAIAFLVLLNHHQKPKRGRDVAS